MWRAAIFDFDLTLADSSSAVVECSNHALVSMGFEPADAEEVHRTIGLSLPQAFRALTRRTDPHLENEFSRRFVDRADEVMVDRTEIYPTVPETLASLRRIGLKLAIVSTKYRYRIEAILAKRRLSGAVDLVVGGEDVAEHKPHPEGLVQALARMGVEPSQAVYVGDHPVDAEVAVRAGTAFVAVRTGVSPGDAWSGWAPLAVIDNVSGLIEPVQSREILAGTSKG